MSLPCPSSAYVGIAPLNSYRWHINNRGYANIVQTQDPSNLVYGLVYALTPEDEERLDGNEGVPECYTKEMIPIDYWPLQLGEKWDPESSSVSSMDLLVYIDRKRCTDDKLKAEYVHRINMGVLDAVKIGVPESYMGDMIRKFIPAKGDKDAEAVARKQAMKLEDEP